MFGGVEQLLRDGQDWVFQDQAQLATGFENWGGLDYGAAGLGQSPVTTSGATHNAGVAGGGSGYAGGGGSGGVGGGGGGVGGGAGARTAVGSAGAANGYVAALMNPAAFDSMTSYDEQEWYQ